MAITTRLLFAIGLSLSTSLAGAQSAQMTGNLQTGNPQVAPVQYGPLKNIPISSGDLLDVEIFSTPELSGRLRVDQQGNVTLPLGGNVKVQDMLADQAATAVRERLVSAKLMLHPTVTIAIVEYSSEGVTVLGEVKSPGIYTLLGPRSLYDALASAGGVTTSEGTSITITHTNDSTHPIVVPVATTDYSPVIKATVILPGDTVMVNRAPVVYVVGDTVRSGAFFIQGGTTLTVLNVISLAQGVNRTAAMRSASVIRQMPDGRAQTIHFDLNKVMRNEEKDIAMQAGDVLVLPRSGLKSFGLFAVPALTNAVSSAVTVALIK